MIEKAIKHLKTTFSKERIYRKKEDLEALNDLVKGFNNLEEQNLRRNKLFVKMFMHEFLRQTSHSGRTSKETLVELHRILETSVSQYYDKMRKEVPYLRFKALSDDLGLIPLYEEEEGLIKVNNSPEVEAHNKKLLEKHHKVLSRALSTEYSDRDLEKFLSQYLNQTILDYSSYD